MSLLMSRRDLAFLLYDWLDAQALVALPRYAEHSRETFDAVLDTSERIAEDLFAHAARGDRGTAVRRRARDADPGSRTGRARSRMPADCRGP